MVGDQKQYTQQTQGDALWEDTCSFLIQNLATDTVQFSSFLFIQLYNILYKAAASLCMCVCLSLCLSVCLYPVFLHDRWIATKFGRHVWIDLGMVRTLSKFQQTSGKCHELSRKSIHFFNPIPPGGWEF